MSTDTPGGVNGQDMNGGSQESSVDLLREISELKESLRLEKSKKRDMNCEFSVDIVQFRCSNSRRSRNHNFVTKVIVLPY